VDGVFEWRSEPNSGRSNNPAGLPGVPGRLILDRGH
jgi:hypothetical protein